MKTMTEGDLELHRLYLRAKRGAPKRCARCGGCATWGGRPVRSLRKHDGTCIYAKHWHCGDCCARPMEPTVRQWNDVVMARILSDIFENVQVTVT